MRSGRTSSARVVSPASTFRTTGSRGSAARTAPSTSASRSAAGAIRRQWNGALTGRMTLRFPPRVAASATARSTAARWPATTIWPGELMFATSRTSPPAASRQISSTTSRSTPRTAAMAPVPTGTASCMNSPRRRTTRTASPKDNAPADTRAEYSPRLCPPTTAGVSPRSARRRAPATLTVSTAGCVLAVSCSSDSGPSKQSFATSKPSASLASSNTARAAADVSWNARPMPTACEPWPGKQNARRASAATRIDGHSHARAVKSDAARWARWDLRPRGRVAPRRGTVPARRPARPGCAR